MTRAYSLPQWHTLALALALALCAAFVPSSTHAASMPITGYAWSAGTDTVTGQSFPFMGWIEMRQVQEDTETGALSGYAWSPYFGWISFQSGDSAHPNPRVDKETGKVTGWLRSCAAFRDKNTCSGALDSNVGGWDGWISLEGPGYGVVQSDTCEWSGYAWGAASVAGVSFSGPGYQVTGITGDPACKRTSTKPNLTASAVSVPSTVNPGVAINLSSTILNNGALTTGQQFPVLFQIHPGTTPPDSIANTAIKKNTAAETLAAGGSVLKTVTHTFPTAGKWIVRACADMSSIVPSAIDESNEDDNCGNEWKEITVGTDDEEDDDPPTVCTPPAGSDCTATNNCGFPTPGRINNSCNCVAIDPSCTRPGGEGAPTVKIDATPLRVPKGDETTLTWEATNVQGCRISGESFSNGLIQGPTIDGEKKVAITEQEVFVITCEPLDGSANRSEQVIVNILPDFNEF